MARLAIKTIIAVFLLLNVAGCSRSKDDKYYIRGKMNGKSFSFSGFAEMRLVEIGVDQRAVFLAKGHSRSDLKNSIRLDLLFSPGKKIEPREYDSALPQGFTLHGMYYGNDDSNPYITYGYTPTAHWLKLQVHKITDEEIAGSFEGDFFRYDIPIPSIASDTISFTGGKFRLPVVK